MTDSGSKTAVADAVQHALREIDRFLGQPTVTLGALPPASLRHAADDMLGRSASVRTAGLFLAFFSLGVPTYDFSSVPVGWRGGHGDKGLCEGLTRRSLTLHEGIVAYGENVGWKGNQGGVDPAADSRFSPFARTMAEASPADRERAALYLAARFAESRRLLATLPPVGDDVLTFVRAKALFHALATSESEGFLPQFLVAALLEQSRRGTGIDVVTHHPHASDTSDRTAGDVEERLNGVLVRAYEVTARPDWQNRLSGLARKMDAHALTKYVVLATGVNADPTWSEPAQTALALNPVGRDIAVVDLFDALNWWAASLSARALRDALRGVEAMVQSPTLCRRPKIADLYAQIVGAWLDDAEP